MFKEPYKIKNLILNNRLVMPPMATENSDNGLVTNKLIDYYDEKTKGGYIGLVISEHSYISLEGKASKNQLSIASDDVVEGLSKLTQTVHNNGSKIIAQISHAGSAAKKEITGLDSLAPSKVLLPRRNLMPDKVLDKEDISRLIDDYVNASLRAKKANFDGVEIHSAHGYLLNQFYSPLTNLRSDEYNGNTLEGRINLHLAIIKAIKEKVGEDFLIAIRLGGSDYMENGTTVSDTVKAAKIFKDNGLDLLDISGGLNGYINPFNNEEAYFRQITKAIKKEVDIPTILTGGIIHMSTINELLNNKEADLIGIGRPILKDSLFAKKLMEENNDN